MRKTNQIQFRVIKRKDDRVFVKWESMIILSTGFMKKILLYKISYFPEPFNRCINKIKVQLDLPNYATKSDLEIAASADKLKFAEKANLPSLKSDINKLDIDKLEKVSSG